jgi:parallel beta-helix repeat protein
MLATARQSIRVHPIAFLSYVHSDDAYGHITEFCARLAAEVQAQLGEEFRIFQDRNDISWGQHWRQRIDEGVDAATFLVPIVTPGYFNSDYCRGELERLLKHERKRKRKDLILPVYYIDTALLNDENRRREDKLATVIAARQWVDWRDLRFEPYTSPQVGKTLAALAVQVREALDRPARGAPATPAAAKRTRRAPARRRATAAPAEDAMAQETAPTTWEADPDRVPAAKTQPPTLTVSPVPPGDYLTISEAIAAAQPGTRILVQPGHYREGLVIDKPLEILGDGNRDDIVIWAADANAVLFRTTMGRVTNLSLRQAGGGSWFAVDISQGHLELEDCDISSESLSCIAIHSGADPRVRRNRIHDGKRAGVFVCENGLGLLEDNVILHNTLAGVEIRERGNPTLRRNGIHYGQQAGVYVHRGGLGVLEDNEVAGNAHSGVVVQDSSSPTLRRNRITENGWYGVLVRESGGGTFEQNDLRGNAAGPWYISDDSLPNVKRSGNIEE